MESLWIYIVALCIPLIIFILPVFHRLVKWFFQIRKIQAAVDKFAVTDRHWLYGHTDVIPELNEKGLMKFLEYTASKSNKGAFPFYLGNLPILMLCHPDTLKVISKTLEPKGLVAGTGSGYYAIVPWLGDGLLTSKGQKWQRNRKLLTPGFHFEILKPYVQIYNKCVDYMLGKFASDGENGDNSVEIIQHISLCTLNIIRSCAFSAGKNDFDIGLDSNYLKAVNEMSDLLIQRMMNPLYFFDAVYSMTHKGKRFNHLCRFTHDLADNIIRKRRQQLSSKNESTQIISKNFVDFLDILLLAKDKDGRGLTDLEIRDEVETFMFGGHDTTSSAISWLLYNLACHPHIQKQAQEEVDALFKTKSQEEVEWDDFNAIPYVTRCIKESLRLHPPVPFADRELSKPLELIDGHVLPPGTIVGINIYTVHHNPRLWGEDHMEYNPDRFLPDNISRMDSHAFIPFSAGPRNCIGQVFAMNEIKTTVVRILHRFNLAVDKNHTVEMKADILLRAKYGIKLFFEERVRLP